VSAAIDEGRTFLVVSANKMDLLDLDGTEYATRLCENVVPEQLEMWIPKSGGYGLGSKDNRKKRMIQ
jgi:hypothetical protein